MATATGTFEITMTPAPAEAGGAIGRFDFAKTFAGGLDGTSVGVFLSCGNPPQGEAGYVAIETVEGRLGERVGSFALQQMGLMHDGAHTLHYEVVPGSGRDGLDGLVGTFHLDVETDGTHRYELDYRV